MIAVINWIDSLDRLADDAKTNLQTAQTRWFLTLRHRQLYDGKIAVETANISTPYSFEFIGSFQECIVITPMIEKFQMHALVTLASSHGCLLDGPDSSGKLFSCQDLAAQCGRHFVRLPLSDQLSEHTLSSFLTGAAASGSWLFTEALCNVNLGILSILAEFVHTAFFSAMSKQTELSRFYPAEKSVIREGFGLFCSLSGIAISSTRYIPENFRTAYRPFSFQLPNISIVLEAHLKLFGVKDPATVSRQLVALMERGENILSVRSHAVVQLRSILRELKYIRWDMIKSGTWAGEISISGFVIAMMNALCANIAPEDFEVCIAFSLTSNRILIIHIEIQAAICRDIPANRVH